MAHRNQDDAILPTDNRTPELSGQILNAEQNTDPEYGSQDKLGDREKNSDGSIGVGSADPHLDSPPESTRERSPFFRAMGRYRRPLIHFFIFGLFTGWWVASLILHRNDKNWVVPFLVWLAIMLRLVTYYIPIRYVSQPIQWVWANTAVRAQSMVPERLRTICGAAIAIAAILVGAFASEETQDNTRANRAVSLFGLVVILGTFWLTSRHRHAVNWRTVIVGMLAQYIIGLFVLRTGVGYDIFSFIAARAGDLLGFAKDGVAFITSEDTANLGMFFFGVIPAIICK
jgi:CNT family concentrative nucleoside transporter